MDPSLMDHSSGMDRSSAHLDHYVTIGSVTAPDRPPSVRRSLHIAAAYARLSQSFEALLEHVVSLLNCACTC